MHTGWRRPYNASDGYNNNKVTHITEAFFHSSLERKTCEGIPGSIAVQLRGHFSPGQLLRGPANQLASLKKKWVEQTTTKRGQESAKMMDDCNARQLVPLCETVERWVVEN
jgi:hypothetical protein